MAEIEDGDRQVDGESTGGVFDGNSGDLNADTEVTGQVSGDQDGGVFDNENITVTASEAVTGVVEAETPGATFERSANPSDFTAEGPTGETPDEGRGGVFEDGDRGGFVDSFNEGGGPTTTTGRTGPTGSRGPAGPAGPRGEVGPQGPPGNTGPRGPNGLPVDDVTSTGGQNPGDTTTIQFEVNDTPIGDPVTIQPGAQGEDGQTGPQGPQGRYRINAYQAATDQPSAPTDLTWTQSTEALTGLDSQSWTLLVPVIPDGQELWEIETVFDPGNPGDGTVSVWSAVFQAGSQGPAGPPGEQGLSVSDLTVTQDTTFSGPGNRYDVTYNLGAMMGLDAGTFIAPQGPAGTAVTSVDLTFQNRLLTVDVDGVTGTVTIPGLADPNVTVSYEPSTRELTVQVGTETGSVTLPDFREGDDVAFSTNPPGQNPLARSVVVTKPDGSTETFGFEADTGDDITFSGDRRPGALRARSVSVIHTDGTTEEFSLDDTTDIVTFSGDVAPDGTTAARMVTVTNSEGVVQTFAFDVPSTTVTTTFDNPSRTLTTQVGDNSDTVVIPGGGGGGGDFQFDSPLEEAVFLTLHALDQSNEVRDGPFLSSADIEYGDNSMGTLQVNRTGAFTDNREYRGPSIDALGRQATGATVEQALFRRFTRPGGVFTNRRFWTFDNAVLGAMLTLTENGWLVDSTTIATLTENGFLTATGYTLTENGFLQETS